jgi:hypothetical protein
MKKNKQYGMRPQDILVLLKILSLDDPEFKLIDLSQTLGVSLSEVSDSIGRSVFAQLIAPDRKTPMRKAIYELLVHGVPYVFPAHPGALAVGMPTAHSAPSLSDTFGNLDPVVWPTSEGNSKGQEISPFHPNQAEAAGKDEDLYELLALTDALRIGRAREKKIAADRLKEKIIG